MADIDGKQDVFVSEHVEHSAPNLDAGAVKELHRHGLEGEEDQAAKILEAAGGQVNYSAQERKRLLRKIDFYVCVPMCLTYFIQQVS